MNLQEFYKHREERLKSQIKYRSFCQVCQQPEFGCYCAYVKKFDPQVKFVILIHPIEVRRRIATGRMSHLCLENSELIMGQDYSQNDQVNKILQSPEYQSVILYPGRQSINLTHLSETKKKDLIPSGKKLAIFVIDGTWATARRMVRLSQNLHHLPKVCFTPRGLSQFRVRKQPAPECLSTIEAIHHTIELLGPHVGFDCNLRTQDNLLTVFNLMVERQLECIRQSFANPKPGAYRLPSKDICLESN